MLPEASWPELAEGRRGKINLRISLTVLCSLMKCQHSLSYTCFLDTGLRNRFRASASWSRNQQQHLLVFGDIPMSGAAPPLPHCEDKWSEQQVPSIRCDYSGSSWRHSHHQLTAVSPFWREEGHQMPLSWRQWSPSARVWPLILMLTPSPSPILLGTELFGARGQRGPSFCGC